ncbi:MAG: response regulator [bacterium]
MKIQTALIAIILNLIFWGGALAQVPQDIQFDHYDATDGFDATKIEDIFQDSTGYIWFCAGNSGLYRFDGNTFHHYQSFRNDSTSISLQNVQCGFIDKKGRIWIGTSAGLNLYHPETNSFENYCENILGNCYINDIVQAENDRLWLGTWDGLVLFDPATQQAEKYRIPYEREEGNEFFYDIKTMYKDSRQRLWLGTFKNGVHLFDIKTKKYTHWFLNELNKEKQVINNYISDITEDSDGNIWISTWGSGLKLYDEKNEKFQTITFKTNKGISYNQLKNICKDNDIFWIASQKGFIYFNPKTREHIYFDTQSSSPYGYKGVIAHFIFKDNNNGIWIPAGTSTLNYFNLDRQGIKSYPYDKGEKNSPSSTIIRDIESTPDGKIVVEYLNELDIFDPDKETFSRISPDIAKNNTNFFGMAIDKNNEIWLLSDKLYNFNTAPDKIISFYPEQLHLKEIAHFYSEIVVDEHNNLWIKGENELIYKSAQKNIFTKFVFPGNINNIRLAPDNTLWFADSCLKSFPIKDSSLLLADSIIQVKNNSKRFSIINHQINTRVFAFGPEGKIHCINNSNDSIIVYNPQTGKKSIQKIPFQNSPPVVQTFLYNEQENEYWLGTNTGLYKFNVEQNDIIHLTISDGLPDNNIINNLSLKNNKYLYFSGRQTFFRVNPEQIRKNTAKPKLIISNIKIQYRDINDTGNIEKGLPYSSQSPNFIENIELKHNQNSITFEFALLNYLNPEKNRYTCILEGHDDGWVDLGSNNFVRYSNLPKGQYVFRVKAQNNDGVWTDSEKEITLTVYPPWWASNLAKALYIVIAAGLFFLIKKTLKLREDYLKKLEIEKLKFRSQQELMEKDRELEQDKMRFFMNMSHEFRTPLTLILGPVQQLMDKYKSKANDLQQFKLIERNALLLQGLINHILDLRKLQAGKMNLNLSNTDIIQFLINTFNSFSPLAEKQNIQYYFTLNLNDEVLAEKVQNPEIPDSISFICAFDHDKLEKILYNLLSNAFKYGEINGKVCFNVKIINQKISIRIFNSGEPIDEDHLTHIFDRFYQIQDKKHEKKGGSGIGLALTKELVNLHQGEIYAHPSDNGNTFEVEIPLNLTTPTDNCQEKTKEIQEDKAENFNTEDENNPNDIIESNIILIVDDNEDIRYFIKSNINNKYKVIEAANGQEGLQKAFEFIPDIIISDIMMPKMNGIEFMKNIKNNIHTSHIPVILLTAKNAEEQQIEGYLSGAHDYISKPFSIKKLELKIDNILQSRKLFQNRLITNINKNSEIKLENAGDNEFIVKLIEIVKKNLSNPEFGINELCKEAAVSKSKLYRKLNALTGQTISEFIRNYRLKHAANLLRSTQHSISEIAYSAGFNDITYFSNCFKKHFGQTASEYRAQKDKS